MLCLSWLTKVIQVIKIGLPDIKYSIPKDLWGIQNAWTSMLTAGFCLAFIVTQKVSYGKSVTASSTYKKGSLLRWVFDFLPVFHCMKISIYFLLSKSRFMSENVCRLTLIQPLWYKTRTSLVIQRAHPKSLCRLRNF